jgi:hypothetical protein
MHIDEPLKTPAKSSSKKARDLQRSKNRRSVEGVCIECAFIILYLKFIEVLEVDKNSDEYRQWKAQILLGWRVRIFS